MNLNVKYLCRVVKYMCRVTITSIVEHKSVGKGIKYNTCLEWSTVCFMISDMLFLVFCILLYSVSFLIVEVQFSEEIITK